MTNEEIELHQKVRLLFIQSLVNRSGTGPDDVHFTARELMEETKQSADDFVNEYNNMRRDAMFAGCL